jgi:hypothetical protein
LFRNRPFSSKARGHRQGRFEPACLPVHQVRAGEILFERAGAQAVLFA